MGGGGFNTSGVEEKMFNLASIHTCHAFAVIRAADNIVKIVHSLGRYVKPVGSTIPDLHTGRFFAFKGDRTQRHDPPAMYFTTSMMLSKKVKIRTLDKVNEKFAKDNPSIIIPLDDSEDDWEVATSVMLPLKWASDIIDLNPTPHQFLEYIKKNSRLARCGRNCTGRIFGEFGVGGMCGEEQDFREKISQLAIPLVEADNGNDAFEDWADARLSQTLGGRRSPSTLGSSGGGGGGVVIGNGGVQPVFNVMVPDIPRPSLDEMDLAYIRGADAQKRIIETVVPSGSKYTDKQLVHLLAF